MLRDKQIQLEIYRGKNQMDINNKSRARVWNQDLKQEEKLDARLIHCSTYQFKTR